MSDRMLSIETAEHIRNQVIEHLHDKPRSFAELHDLIPEITDKQQLSNALYRLKNENIIMQREDRNYVLSDSNSASSSSPRRATNGKPKKQVKPLRRMRASRIAEPAKSDKPNGNVSSIFEKLLLDAQTALDNYVYSVGDKLIIDQLMAARDAAREALRASRDNGHGE